MSNPMKINLSLLAITLARSDDPTNYNASVIDTEVALAQLGKYLRSVGPWKALQVFKAIYQRAGK